jgi:hypothetical protein
LLSHLGAPTCLVGAYFACAGQCRPQDEATIAQAAARRLSCHPMQFDVPDPRYTHSAHSHALLALAVRLSIGFVALLWLVHLMNWGLDLDPRPFGLRHRHRTAGAR